MSPTPLYDAVLADLGPLPDRVETEWEALLAMAAKAPAAPTGAKPKPAPKPAAKVKPAAAS